VHSGFLEVFNSVQDKVIPAVQSLMSKYPSYNVNIIGQSLGGALANLLAQNLARKNTLRHFNLFTYGEPRVGNPAFALSTDALTNLRAHRLVNSDDIVPHRPGSIFGYQHHDQEFWVTKVGGAIDACTVGLGHEDKKCSWTVNGVVDRSKHNVELGVNFWSQCPNLSAKLSRNPGAQKWYGSD